MRLVAGALLLAAVSGGRAASSAAPGRSPTAPAELHDSAGGSDAVRAELERCYRDFSDRDWSAYADHFWPGATLTTVWAGGARPTGGGCDGARVRAAGAVGPGSKPIFAERRLGAGIRVHGNLAQAWTHYEARFGTPDSVAAWRGFDAFTLMAHAGRWRIVALAYTDE